MRNGAEDHSTGWGEVSTVWAMCGFRGDDSSLGPLILAALRPFDCLRLRDRYISAPPLPQTSAATRTETSPLPIGAGMILNRYDPQVKRELHLGPVSIVNC